VDRAEYLEVLAALRDRPAVLPTGRLAVADLA
jgi:hypothetical protein